ncbi:MAG: hypothetical protein Q8Q89_04665 [bacterium]|nr:hypothetical protein [bacterium]
MAKSLNKQEPTPDQISMAILQMLNNLKLIDGMEILSFPENVAKAIKDFDRPELRLSLARRLYHPERYVPDSKL